MLSGSDALIRYHKHPEAPLKLSCNKCGILTHATGDAPWMDGPYVSVFVNTLDDVGQDELAAAPVHFSDGLHDNWMNPPQDIRNL